MSSAPQDHAAPHRIAAIELARDLRSAAAMVREYDWRRLAKDFDGHRWPPLALLADAAGAASLSLRPHEIGPTQVLVLAESDDARALIYELLVAFLGFAP